MSRVYTNARALLALILRVATCHLALATSLSGLPPQPPTPSQCINTQCATNDATGRADAALLEALSIVQSSLDSMLRHKALTGREMALMSLGMLDGLQGDGVPEQGFFTRVGLGQAISEASDELICKSKDFFGSYFDQGWPRATVIAENVYFREQWALLNDTQSIRRCLNQNTRPGHERAPECMRRSNRTTLQPGCLDSTPCALLGDALAPNCGVPRGGICGAGSCHDVYTTADLSIVTCLAWREASAHLLAWPQGGGLESLALYGRQAVFSLLLAHATLLTRSSPRDLQLLRTELLRSATWMTARLDLYEDPEVHHQIIRATSSKAVVDSADFQVNTMSRFYSACGKKLSPPLNLRPYRHFIRYGCPARAEAPRYADGPSSSILGYIQKDDEAWCRGAEACMLDQSQTSNEVCTTWSSLSVEGNAPYIMESFPASVCQANFVSLKKVSPKPNECATDGNAAKCQEMESQCRTYIDALWETGIRDGQRRLPGVIAHMHVTYRKIARIFKAQSNQHYEEILNYAQTRDWPLVLD
jgi:hypothetical protein